MLKDLSSDYPSILLTILLFPLFGINKRPFFFNFQIASWDDLAFYFDFRYPSVEKYASFCLSSAAEVFKIVRLTSLLSDMPRMSSPKPRLKHGRRYAHLSVKSDPKSVYSLCSVASFSSSSSSPDFPNCSSPRKSAAVFADSLRSHIFPSFYIFSDIYIFFPCFSELRRATCSEEPHFSFCSSFFPAEFPAAATNLIGPDTVAYSS